MTTEYACPDCQDTGIIGHGAITATCPCSCHLDIDQWEKLEREADEDLAKGRYKDFDTMEEMIEDLDRGSK